jgi:alkylation response protein AidB-like acyl-CoA dehydrogenase
MNSPDSTVDFREQIRAWLAEHLPASLIGVGGPGREHEQVPERLAWERTLGAGGWIGLGWDSPYGGRAGIERQVIFFEEYARAGAPGRLSHVGEYLLAPTLIAFGSAEQQARFLPPIARAEQLWCQGYSEPDAGSDLAAVRTSAVLDGDVWRVTGQKVWTSMAHLADWCFVLCRTADAPTHGSSPAASRHAGLSFLLVPMRQPGVEVRPIVQLTGDAEFCEVFFDGAVTAAENVVGPPGHGWRVATGTLAFERGVATLGQQVGFSREFQSMVDTARTAGTLDDPVLRDRMVAAWVGLQTLRHHALRTLGSDPTPITASVAKLLWAPWHQRLGELALEAGGASATDASAGLTGTQRLFLFSRADTIYGGSNEIQRMIIANHLLGRS